MTFLASVCVHIAHTPLFQFQSINGIGHKPCMQGRVRTYASIYTAADIHYATISVLFRDDVKPKRKPTTNNNNTLCGRTHCLWLPKLPCVSAANTARNRICPNNTFLLGGKGKNGKKKIDAIRRATQAHTHAMDDRRAARGRRGQCGLSIPSALPRPKRSESLAAGK